MMMMMMMMMIIIIIIIIRNKEVLVNRPDIKIKNKANNICFLMVKVKLSLRLTKHHAMKAYCGSGGIAPRIR
jgi:energy-converting hydrogenase Eha subunit H